MRFARLTALATLALALLAAPLAAAKQAGKVYRIAIVTYPTQPSPAAVAAIDAFRRTLRELGWVEGRNVLIERRGTEQEKLPELAAQVVREKFDLIVTDHTPAALAAKGATTTIPIVMATSADPIGGGVVGGLAHPGGNVTGLTVITPDVAGKRLELLKEMVPGLRLAAAVYAPGRATFPVVADWLIQSEVAARALGITLQRAEILGAERWDAAFAALKKDGVGAVIVVEGPRYILEAPQIAAAALKHRLPTAFPIREQVEAGGLMSYGANLVSMWQRAAHLADRILRGAKPADLPIEQPTKFELVINLKTAKALGLTIPPAVLARADEIIQ
jgi:ABC-type uncharacterized transport system substrate-binding protein